MRAGALRSVSVAPESRAARAVPMAARRASGARAAVGVASGSAAFLAAYAALHALAALGYHPRAVTAIASIPLFARFVACVVFAAATGGVSAALARDPGRWLRALPRILAGAIVAFAGAVALLP
jgi:hypothetical protein